MTRRVALASRLAIALALVGTWIAYLGGAPIVLVVVLAVVSLGAALAHVLRPPADPGTVASTKLPDPTKPSAPTTPDASTARGRRRRGRSARVVTFFAIALVFAVVSSIGAVVGRRQAERSARVQHHGIHVVGAVTDVVVHRDVSVTNHHHRVSYTTVVRVALDPPIDGHSSTAVEEDGQHYYAIGPPLAVLVDPDDAGYAELPGRGVSPTVWKVVAGAAAVLWVLSLLAAELLVRDVRRRRSARAAETVGGGF